jgi:hypothetical protein
MLNPVYFNYGIAVHGAYEVPRHPASHGCIRIPNLVSAAFQDLVEIGEQVFVFDGVEEPEHYGAQSGRWDWADPDYSTTTTTDTTTATTAPASSTEEPATSTTPPTTPPPATRPATTAPPTTQPPTTRPAPPTTRPPAPPPTTTTAPPTTTTTTTAALPSG